MKRRTWQLGALGALVWMGGCSPEQGPTPVFDTMTVSAPSTLEADGSTTAEVQIRAGDTAGAPNNEQVTIELTGIDGAPTDAAELNDAVGGSAIDNGVAMTDGAATLRFKCPARTAGTYEIKASNSKASNSARIRCTTPLGSVHLDFDDSECQSLQADGQSECRVGLTTTYFAVGAAQGEPENLPVTLTVETATGPEDKEVLSTGPNGDGLESITLTTANGAGSFYVKVPAAFGTGQTTTIAATIDSTFGLVTTPLTITVEDAVDQSALTVDNAAQALVGDGTSIASVTFSAVTPLGTPASPGDTIRVTVSSPEERVTVRVPDQADPSMTRDIQDTDTPINLAVDAQGQVTVQIVAPTIGDDGADVSVAIEGEYQAAEWAAPQAASANVTFQEPGSLLLSVTGNEEPIRSDLNTELTLRATVSVAGGVANGQDVHFFIPTTSRANINFGPRGDETVTGFERVVSTDADGVATVVVSSQNERVRATGTVVVTVDNGEQTRSQNVAVSVERNPILQSIVWVANSVPTIGVRGGAIDSAAEVSFRLVDDVGEPMLGVPVSFAVNDTAAAGTSVVADDVSDASGTVSTILSAGTQAGTVSVVATVLPPTLGAPLAVESQPVSIVGGLPSLSNSQLLCGTAGGTPSVALTIKCTATLADRFSNAVPAGYPVHFRAEGGQVDAVAVTDAAGRAEVEFTSGAPGLAPVDVRHATWGALVPLSAGDLAGGTFDASACFDTRSSTPCDLIALCKDPALSAYCPLPVDDMGQGCWETTYPNPYYERHAADSPAADPFVDGPGRAREVAESYVGAHGAAMQSAARALVDRYLANRHNCGVEQACVDGHRDGLSYLGALGGTVVTTCPIAAGCYDFTNTTNCTHSGMITVMGSFRGEESFDDVNGNGVYDADEPFVDAPEPFLDKQNNGLYTSFESNARMSPLQKTAASDLFIDESGDGEFGYSGALTNGQFDRDKDVFFSAHAVWLSGVGVRAGAACVLNGSGVPTSPCGGVCLEIGQGPATFDPGCFPDLADAPPAGVPLSGPVAAGDQAATIFVDVSDTFGNLAFEEAEGAVEFTVVGDAESAPDAIDADVSYAGFDPLAVNRQADRPWITRADYLGAGAFRFVVRPNCPDLELTEGQSVFAKNPTALSAEVTAAGLQTTLYSNVTCYDALELPPENP